jgi:hypothetical protein
MERSIGQGLLKVQAPGNRSRDQWPRLRLPGVGSMRVYGRGLFPWDSLRTPSLQAPRRGDLRLREPFPPP